MALGHSFKQAFPPSLVEPLQHAAGRGLWNAYGPTDWGNAVGLGGRGRASFVGG